MMTHRNTSHQDLGLSPAEMLYGRVIRHHLPILHKRWWEIRELRERAMAKRHLLNQKHYNIHSHPLRELQVGESVQVQNQEGPLPRRWMKTGRQWETSNTRYVMTEATESRCVTGNFSGKSFWWWTHRTIRPKNHNHSLKGSRQWNSTHRTWNDGGSRYGCRRGDGGPHRHGGWKKSTPNCPTATESGPETHYKSNTPTKVTLPTNAGTGPLLLRVIPASDHKALVLWSQEGGHVE